MTISAPPLEDSSLTGVLSEIAETASETFELQEVFERVVASVRRVIPVDHMGVVRILDGEWAVKHATTFGSACRPTAESRPTTEALTPDAVLDGALQEQACTEPMPLATWSPRIRPRPGPIRRVDHAETELDPAFLGDSKILEAGIRSTLWEPFRTGSSFGGGVWLSSYRARAFTDEHQEFLRPIAALLGSAVEHWRIYDAERRRRDRLDRLETLLGTLAESLDVRDVFARISDAAKPVLPHDALVLTELDVPARTLRIVALEGTPDNAEPPVTIALTEKETASRLLEFEIIRDIPTELTRATERDRILLDSGMRSWLRVPVRLLGETRGSLGFFHREPARYDRGDVEVATRLADRVALMLSHQRLAEEARVAAEARERADRLEATVETLARALASRGRGRIVGTSRSWKKSLQAVGRVASSETTVLITGESGTGKEVIANLIHQGSPRSEKPFVAINCAALPEQLLESELFGHEKGAFTGAVATKIGRIEQAAGGTLFLDEVAEMSPLVQAKLLRVLEAREFQRLGATRTLKADVRVIAATNRDLASAMARQTFREDLYYRLNVFQIPIAPLRQRTEDVLPLAEAFLEELGRTMGRPAAGISQDARGWLLTYPWPGNVRELRNAIERAILLCDGGLITRDHLPAPMARSDAAPAPATNGHAHDAASFPAEGVDLGAVERGLLEKAMGEAKGNKSKAARLLGLTRAQLYSRLDKYGVA